VAELRGDQDGKLAADALLGGERATDPAGLRAISDRISEIDEITEEMGSTEALENEKVELLLQVRGHASKKRLETGIHKAYHNIAAQKNIFLNKLKEKMPQLAAHLKACLRLCKNDYSFSYKPPAGTPCWKVENPTT
jgi:hypothetical protein